MRWIGRWTAVLALLFTFDAHAGTLVITPPSVSFGSVSVAAGPASLQLTIMNQGSTTVISGFTSAGGCAEFAASAANLPAELFSGMSLMVTVTYDPANRGSDACTFTIQDNNGVADAFDADGVGTAPKLLLVTTTLGFADQAWDTGTGETKNVLIQNVGNEEIGAIHLGRQLTTGVHFSLGTTSFPIGPQENGIIPVTFNPTSIGLKSDVLTVSLDNDLPAEPSPAVILSGAGTSSTADVGDVAPLTGIRAVRPSPTRGTMTVEYSIPRPGRVALEACDLSGRRVGWSQTYASVAGRHSATWREGIEWSPSAGVHLVRLSLDGRVLGTRRVVVLR